jgi:hypothetical protein
MTYLVPRIDSVSFALNSSFYGNPAQTHDVEISTGLTCVEAMSPGSHNSLAFVTLFPFCHFHFHLSAHVLYKN